MMLEGSNIQLQMDEPALSLWEGDLVVEGMLQRVQRIRAVRGESIVEYTEVLGLALAFAADPIYIPAGEVRFKNGVRSIMPVIVDFRDVQHVEAWHTVGELRDMADEWRMRPSVVAQREPTDLISGYHNLVEKSRPNILRTYG